MGAYKTMSDILLHKEGGEWELGDIPTPDPADLRTYEYLNWADIARLLEEHYGQRDFNLIGMTVEQSGIELAFGEEDES